MQQVAQGNLLQCYQLSYKNSRGYLEFFAVILKRVCISSKISRCSANPWLANTKISTGNNKGQDFYVLLTVHLGSILVNNQLEAQFFFSYIFIPILYMFRAPLCSSSGESIVIIHLVYVTLKTSEWTKITKSISYSEQCY